MTEKNMMHISGACPECKCNWPLHDLSCSKAQGAIGKILEEWKKMPGIPYHEIICGHPEPEKKQGVKLVYVAGPYRAETREGVAQNVAAARHVGQLCVRKGWFPVLPTVNTAHFDHDYPGLADDQYWLDGTMELMRRCDAVVLVDGWQYSSGAKAEIEEARKLGLKVYLSTNVMPQLEKVTA